MSGNLPYKTTDEELNTLFSQAGPVDNVRVMRDMATGRARGFAFVEMGTDDAAQKAITQFHGHRLRWASSRRQRGAAQTRRRRRLSARRITRTGHGRTARTALVASFRSSPNLTRSESASMNAPLSDRSS